MAQGTKTLGDGALSSLMFTFQRDGSRSLRKIILGCETGKRLLKRFIPQRVRKRIYSYKFSMKRKFRFPESGRRLPLSQAEGNGNGETISVTCLAQSSPQGEGLLCFSEPVDETASFSLSSLLTFVRIKVTSTSLSYFSGLLNHIQFQRASCRLFLETETYFPKPVSLVLVSAHHSRCYQLEMSGALTWAPVSFPQTSPLSKPML